MNSRSTGAGNTQMKHCSQCNVEFPDHFEFCGSCGRRLDVPAQEVHSAADLPDITIERGAPVLTSLSAYDEPEVPSEFRWWPAIVGLSVLLVVIVLGIGGWYWWSQQQSNTQTSQASNPGPEPAAENPSTAPSYQPTSAITPQQETIATTADEEIRQIRAKRIGANASERVDVIPALEQAEKKYPNDYRFPYELSKLSIKGTTSHHEAFERLARAAQKAIDNGQSDEMLNSLMADKDGDFHKLSHGHHEWEDIEQALRQKNPNALKITAH